MSSDLTPARLEELLAAATPGPWHVDGLHTSAVIVRMSPYAWRRVAETDASTFHNPNWRADAALIAFSPALAARVIELEAENARLREALGDMLDDCEPDRPGAPRLSIREAARAVLNGGDYEA